MPGQKTNASINRKTERDLRRLNSDKSVVTIVPVIRWFANKKKLARTDEFHTNVSLTTDARPMREKRQTLVVASLLTIGIVHLRDNTLKQDNVDSDWLRFLTFGIIGKPPLIDTQCQAGNPPAHERSIPTSRAQFAA